ncbi:MAG: hypothetical protein ACFFF9_11520 [Candidatus Thorarchaeota archaeon]
MRKESLKLIIEALLVSAMWISTLTPIILIGYSFPVVYLILFVGLTLSLIGDISLELYKRKKGLPLSP